MYMSDPGATIKTHYVCQYCRPILNQDKLPSRCVLNGLEVEDPLSKQLIQKAKAFQAVYRLGTYMGKVPSHNSLKACKGTMFFLPLPLEKTVKTMEEVPIGVGVQAPVGLQVPVSVALQVPIGVGLRHTFTNYA